MLDREEGSDPPAPPERGQPGRLLRGRPRAARRQDVVAHDEQAAGAQQPCRGAEVRGRIRAVDERLDGEREVGAGEVGGRGDEVALADPHPGREAGPRDQGRGGRDLRRADRDPLADEVGAAGGEVDEAAADAAAEIDDAGRRRVREQRQDDVVDVVERPRACADPRRPHRPVDRRPALAEAPEAGGVAVVEPPHPLDLHRTVVGRRHGRTLSIR